MTTTVQFFADEARRHGSPWAERRDKFRIMPDACYGPWVIRSPMGGTRAGGFRTENEAAVAFEEMERRMRSYVAWIDSDDDTPTTRTIV